MNEQFFNEAMDRLTQRRDENQRILEQRREEIYSKLPEYRELSIRLADTGRKLVSIIMDGGDTAAAVAELEQENRTTSRAMKQLLTAAGYPEDYLQPIYTCPRCHDKGTVDGKWCGCFRRLMLEAAARELNQNSPLELSSFDTFRLEYYPENIDPQLHVSQRRIMQHNLEYCQKYASEFSTGSDSILMCGATGLGKTHLSLAIASVVLERGFSVIYGSMPELMRIIEKEYFGRSDKDTLSALAGCDLLILDDLGAEMSKELYTSTIYEIVNGRICRGLPMIVSTNYDAPELRDHYPDKICSRLLSMHTLRFCGSDIRRILKKQ